MNINTRDMSFVKFNGEEMQWVKVNGVTVYEAWKKLMAQGPVPLVLMKSNGMDLVDYKIFGNSSPEATRIPQEYQEVEYIQNSGAQYIDTGIIPDNSTGIELVYKALDYTTSQYLAGARVGWTGSINYGVNGSGSRTEWDVRFNASATYSSIQRTDHKMKTKIILNNGNGTWDIEDLETGEQFNTALTNKAVSATTNLMLFAYSDGNIHKKLRIYSCKLYSGEELIKDFVPCYRKSDDVRGMYDLINGVFHEEILNATTVHISKGNHTGLELESFGEKTSNGYKIPVKINGKNIFDMTDLLANSNFSKNENGDYVTSTYVNQFPLTSDLVQKVVKMLKPNVQYTISREAYGVEDNASAEGQVRILADGEVLTRIPKADGLTSSTFTFTQEQIDSITHIYVYGNKTDNPITYKSIQIEEGDLTEYEPYISSTTDIYLNEPLRKLGDYADEINYAQGKIIRRVGHYTYTGLEEGWLKNATTNDGYAAYRIEGLFEPLIGAPNDTAYMTHFNYTTKGATADFVPGEFRFAFSGNNIGSSRVYMATVDKTLEDFMVWVTNTNPTIYYPIADTPEEINLPAIPTLEKTTILQIDTTIQPDHVEVVYIGK